MREQTANLVHPVVAYALNVYEKLQRGEALDREQVQAVLKGLLGGGLEPSLWSDFAGESASEPAGDASRQGPFLGIRFALVCWLDELFVIDSPWSAEWNAHKLETALYGSNDRAWKFWEQARQADVRLGSDALEVFLLCVALGFRGRLHDQPERLEEWMRTAKARLTHYQGPAAAPPTDARSPELAPLHGSAGWLWQLLGREQEPTDYPEMDAAWEEAVEALRDADIDPVTTPLFLLLGRTLAGDEAFFDAAFPAEASRLLVRNSPARPDAPLHVFATREAIYVTCPDVGLLGGYSTLASGEMETPPGTGASLRREPVLATIGVGRLPFPNGLPSRSHAEPSRKRARAPGRALVENAAEVAEGRLRRLGRLLVRERRTGAPVNGILMRFPFTATERDGDADRAAHCCRRDLVTIRAAVGICCPVFALVCDLETAPGFTEFVKYFPADRRHHRLGQSVPWQPAANSGEVVRRITEGVRKIGEELLPTCIHQSWQVEHPGTIDLRNAQRDNVQLHRLWCQLRERLQRFTALFAACAEEQPKGPRGESWFGGFYLAATGRTALGEQAFVAGVVQKMYDRRKYLAWTREALDEDRTYWRWSLYGIAAVGVMMLTVAALAWSL